MLHESTFSPVIDDLILKRTTVKISAFLSRIRVLFGAITRFLPTTFSGDFNRPVNFLQSDPNLHKYILP